MNCEALILGSAVQGHVPCAIRLLAPQSVNQVPTHFILLCDVSDSMSDDRKLENIKTCTELVVGLLTTQDSMSLITFGDSATLHFKHLEANETNKATMCSILRGLRPDGCTNLSAGLGYVREVCQGSTQKTGLLILTDGHANRGVYETNGLCRIVQGLRDDFPTLSVHCVAYGTMHNADLLRTIAEDSQGSYAIVNTIEDTATAFGDTLGGLMSCVMQNTTVSIPANSVVHGTQKTQTNGNSCQIRLGDVYAGTKPLVLVDIPEEDIQRAECITVKGMVLPDLLPWSGIPILQEADGRQIDIELVKLRYMCTDILKKCMQWRELSAAEQEHLEAQLNIFIEKVGDEAYTGNPVAELLRGEVANLRSMLAMARRSHLDVDERAYVSQRIATLGLGRGMSTPMAPRVRRQHARGWSVRGSSAHTGVEDPDQTALSDSESVDSFPLAPQPSGFQNSMQTHLSQVLRAASQQPRSDS
jgi:hypothetical protein